MDKKSLVIWFSTFLAMPFVLAQFGGKDEGIDKSLNLLGGGLFKVLQNRQSVLVIAVILFYIIFYSMFSAIASRVKMFEGEGGTGINKSAKLMGHSFAGLCCLGIFAFRENLLDKLPDILGAFGMYGAIAIAGVVYAMTYYGLRGQPEFFGMGKKTASMVPAVLAFMFIGSLTENTFFTQLGLWGIIIVVGFAAFHIFSKYKGKGKDKKVVKAEEDVVEEEKRAERVEAFELNETQAIKNIEDKMKAEYGEEKHVQIQMDYWTDYVNKAAKRIVAEHGYDPGNDKIIDYAKEALNEINFYDEREKNYIDDTSAHLTQMVAEAKKKEEQLKIEIKRIKNRVDEIKTVASSHKIGDKTIAVAEHKMLTQIKGEVDDLNSQLMDSKMIEETAEHAKKIDEMMKDDEEVSKQVIGELNQALADYNEMRKDASVPEKDKEKKKDEIAELVSKLIKAGAVEKDKEKDLLEEIKKLSEEIDAEKHKELDTLRLIDISRKKLEPFIKTEYKELETGSEGDALKSEEKGIVKFGRKLRREGRK